MFLPEGFPARGAHLLRHAHREHDHQAGARAGGRGRLVRRDPLGRVAIPGERARRIRQTPRRRLRQGAAAVRQAAGLRSAPVAARAAERADTYAPRGGEYRAGAAAAANGDARDAPVPYRGRGQPPPPPAGTREPSRPGASRYPRRREALGTSTRPRLVRTRTRGVRQTRQTRQIRHIRTARASFGHTRRRRRRPRPVTASHVQSLDPVWSTARTPAGTPSLPPASRRRRRGRWPRRRSSPARRRRSQRGSSAAGGAADGGGGGGGAAAGRAGGAGAPARDAGGGPAGDARGARALGRARGDLCAATVQSEEWMAERVRSARVLGAAARARV